MAMARTALTTGLVSTLLLCGAPDALAQDTPDKDRVPVAVADTSAPKTLETIVVTGTHIRAVDIETEQPVTVLTRADLTRTGLTGVADIVQSLMVADGPTLNRNVNNGGTGELTVNLRSLGANRTLVLVNGRRWATALDGSVDLTAIPLPMVERVEVLRDGASAIYGSDAIAGVVNIITRRNYSGAELGAYVGQSDHGDGLRREFDFTFGHAAGKWNVAAGAEYGKDDPILAGARSISAVPVFGLPLSASGSLTTPYGLFEPSDSYEALVLIPGTPGTSPDDFRSFDTGRDRSYNFARFNYLQTPQERRAAFAHARFDATSNLAFSADVLFNQRRSAQQLAPAAISFSDYQYVGMQQFGVAADNLYNPFGVVVDSVRIRLAGAGDRRFEQTVDTTRLHFGVEGAFTVKGRDWTWGADLSRVRASLAESTWPYADNEKLALAVGPSFLDAAGTPRCGTPADVIAGCVPLNVFGGPDAVTPAMLDYITVTEHNRKRAVTDDAIAHVTGPLADLPAGALQFAAGVEYRHDSGYDHPDPMIVSGRENGNGTSQGPTQGAYSVREAYLELDVPLLKDRPGARELGLDLATRWSNYSLFGTTTNSQLGLRWKPIADLLVRSNYSEGFRAPSLFEAFGGVGTFTSIGYFYDPCAVEEEPDPSTLAHCSGQGVPADVHDPFEVTATFRGNQKLQPETSRSLTAGLVWSPSVLPGFSASLDWYRIKVRDAIGQPDPQGVVDACYVRGDTAACGNVMRNPDGTLIGIVAPQQNLPGGLETEGWDLGLHWRRDTRAGTFNLRWDAAYVDYWGDIGKPALGAELPDGSLSNGNVAGTAYSPFGVVWRVRSVASLAWQRGPWNASVTARYFSPIKEGCGMVTLVAARVGDPSLRNLCSNPDNVLLGVFPSPENRVASVTYFDLAAGWEAPWNARVTLGVRNAFDRDPPVSYSAFANSFFPDYDVPGRFWWASYRQRF
ncbi:MAG: TonB-dependent receptor [Rhodanobacteraceae bacterium]|nr:MAG: TonB-dependent receptor [Rhodanobacteraceae bacterium]